MSGRFVGIVGDAPLVERRLPAVLGAEGAVLVRHGPLKLACAGTTVPASVGDGVLCLLDGCLDELPELGRSLGQPIGAPLGSLLSAGYRRWGAGLAERLQGDFALLVWDLGRDEGLLARDRLGVRPLFCVRLDGAFCFAGDVGDLLALSPTRPAPDPAAVSHWLAASAMPGTGTLYRGVSRVEPASVVELTATGVRERRYWAPRFEAPLPQAEAELAASVRAALERAVERRLDPERPSAVLMSGGLDSASVAALAATVAPRRVMACSGTFPDHDEVDESALIADLRERLALGGVVAEVHAGGLLESVVEHVRAWQMPLLAWGDFWTLPLLRAAAAQGARVALGGDGGDELFGARAHLMADLVRAGRPRAALALARELPGAGDSPARRQVARVMREWGLAGAVPYRLQEGLRRLTMAGPAPAWLRPRHRRQLSRSADPYAWKRLDGPRWWAEVAYGLSRGVEQSGIFEHQHRRAATAGMRARHPLLDFDVLRVGLRQPPRATFDRHRSRPVLRQSMAGLLPDAVRLRPGKAWFDQLIVDCLTGPDRHALKALLDDPGCELGAYVDLPAMRAALAREPGRADRFAWMQQVWRVVNVECWLRAQSAPADWNMPPGWRPSGARVALRSAPSPAPQPSPRPSDGELSAPFSALT